MPAKIILISTAFFLALLQAQAQNGVAPGLGGIFVPEAGINTRFYYFPNEHSCFGPEVNFFPDEGNDFTDGLEVSFNGHYIFEINEKLGLYPIGGVGWKKVNSQENGWRANMGAGLHLALGRFVPYTEYIYSVGFEDEGIFLVGTFFTFGFHHEKRGIKKIH